MPNMFYYSQNPYYRNIPNSFYSFYPRMARNVRGSFNFNSMLQSAQKGINTINQIIPLYKQIKPIYQQAKSSFDGLKKYIVPRARRTASTSRMQDNRVYEERRTNSASTFNYNQAGPSDPFF